MKKLTNTIRAKVILMFTVPFMTFLAVVFLLNPLHESVKLYNQGHTEVVWTYVIPIGIIFIVCLLCALEYRKDLKSLEK